MAVEKGLRIGRGRTAEVFLWKDNRILKLFLEWCPVTLVEEEVRITRAVHKAGLPVPAVEGIVELDGRRGIIFERIDGPSMLRESTTKLWRFPQLALALAELHVAMHACELSELPSYQHRLESEIRDVSLLPANFKEAALQTLGQLPDGNALCHGDFHPDNVLMSSCGPIIIDWFTTTKGNPLADAAMTSLLLRLGDPLPGTHGRWLIRSGRRLFHSIYLKRYLRLRPASRQQIAAWQLPIAAARLKMNIPAERTQLLKLIETLLLHQVRPASGQHGATMKN